MFSARSNVPTNQSGLVSTLQGTSDTIDWMIARSTFVHVFDSEKVYHLSLFEPSSKSGLKQDDDGGVCCRVKNHINRADACNGKRSNGKFNQAMGDQQMFKVRARIDLRRSSQSPKQSPRIVATPIVSAPRFQQVGKEERKLM
jgi:hypothetical protein